MAGKDDTRGEDWMPSPRVAAFAVLAMLGLGVLLGSATSHIAQSAGISSIVFEVAQKPPAPEPEAAEAAPLAEAPLGSTPPAAESSSAPLLPAPIEEPPTESPPPALPPELPEEPGLPEVEHLFLIVLGENGFEESFGPTSPAPYLAQTLPQQGELLTNYYAVTSGALANQIALLSGQGPTLETAANCPTYADVVPATVSPEGQVEGSGCVYPAATGTLPGQLESADLSWRAYVEDSDNGAAAGQPTSCRHPALGAPDPSQLPLPGDAYLTWRNPFVYFHSIVDTPSCTENDVDLEWLAADLKRPATSPTLSYVVPNACHAGAVAPCEPGQPSGPLATEAFLQAVVPLILESPAYEQGGLIAITSSQAPQVGESADTSSCCIAPAYPNLPPPAPEAEPAVGPVKASGGGGRVGLLLISPFVEAGSVNQSTYANHYSLLLTIEELFGLEKLGYANELALTAFDSTVFNAAAEPGASEPQPAGSSNSATSSSTLPAISSRVARTASSGWPLGSGRSQSR